MQWYICTNLVIKIRGIAAWAAHDFDRPYNSNQFSAMENDYIIRIEELITETSTISLTVGTLYLRDNEYDAQKILSYIRKGLEGTQMTANLFTVDKPLIR